MGGRILKSVCPMQIEDTALAGVKILIPNRYGDDRGFFSESWNKSVLADHGIDMAFVQDNHSLSAATNTVRGLHFQAPPFAQDKLVRCGQGALFDVAVDIRVGSPTYGHWFGVELSAENGKQLLVPQGFLHGFSTLLPNTEIIYKCTNYYNQPSDGAVRFDDPAIGIDWHLNGDAVLSDKDTKAPLLGDFDSPFVWEG